MMQLISLFSGIGGFELAAESMGWDVVASCEINPFGRRHLEFYWPEAYHHDDIHTLTHDTLKKQSRWDPTRPTILTGGFPCQPYSMAGKRRGKEDDRHLWPEMLRVIREVRPNYIVGENVLGLVSWDGGLVFDEVHTDLEREGYEVQAVVIPAAAVNAPHGRDRVWFCARLVKDTMHGGRIQRESFQERTEIREQRHFGSGDTNRFCGEKMAGSAADAKCIRLQRRGEAGNISETERTSCRKRGQFAVPIKADGGRYFPRTDWSDFPTQSPIRFRNDGLSTELDGITFSKWRNESIKAAGNAIVPQVAYSIFRCIQSLHH